MLELRKLLDDITSMSQEMAHRRELYSDLARGARETLASTEVNDELRQKILQALELDWTWRGAEPIEDVLDKRHRPQTSSEPFTLIGVDGSQIYPDRHGVALYYLLNIGTIVLRQGSQAAPDVNTQPLLFYAEAELYDNNQNLVAPDEVNIKRELAEMRALAELSQAERVLWGGDLDRLVVAIKDGQLMLWLGERGQQDQSQLLKEYIRYLKDIQVSGGVPVGFVGKPRSANVVRLLWIAEHGLDAISRDTLQNSKYRALTDRMLFSGLLRSNQRSALFAGTAKVNREYFAPQGQKICFFYMNIARDSDIDAAQIVRVDIPEWVARNPDLLDRVQQAIYSDCAGTQFPYVLVRADELAVVSRQEKDDFEHMLSVAMAQSTGDLLEPSAKARQKELSRGYGR